MRQKPVGISGDIAVDDRGSILFVNGFDLSRFQRLYVVQNHTRNFVRAWHGHKHEAKAVLCVTGAAKLGLVSIDDWDSPSPDLPVETFLLSSAKPQVVLIPPGFANGWMSLTSDCKMVFFSSFSIEQSAEDDYRFSSRLWDPWTTEER